MNQLGRPREAEVAYARARTMSPSSALSQDALARQVEAAHRASDATRAQALALEYIERYPDGRRVKAVRRFGGLP
jgi:transmembrane sensor